MKQTLTVAGIVFVITAVLMYFLMEQVFSARLASAPRDTTITLHPEYTLPYVASGPVLSKPQQPKPLVKDTASSLNSDSAMSCREQVLLNAIGTLNAQLASYRDMDSFSEDSTRYSLAVTWDGSKQEGTRFWRWLTIKPAAYMDSLATVTQTVTQPGARDWIPWGITGVALILLIISMLWG